MHVVCVCAAADLSYPTPLYCQVYEALDFLGRVKWRINGEVLDVIQEAWERSAYTPRHT